jgi:hypothetical protein
MMSLKALEPDHRRQYYLPKDVKFPSHLPAIFFNSHCSCHYKNSIVTLCIGSILHNTDIIFSVILGPSNAVFLHNNKNAPY